MPKKSVCRVHEATVTSCRCPCPDQITLVECNEWCPSYGRPKKSAFPPVHELFPQLSGSDFEHLITDMGSDPWLDGVRAYFTFTNGWGASVIRNHGSYGGDKGLFEMAALGPDGSGDYENPVTLDDPSGWLTPDLVVKKLRRLAMLTTEDLQRFKEYRKWLTLREKVDDAKREIVQLWEDTANLYHSEEERFPDELENALNAVNAAFERFRVEDPGIPVDEH